MLYTYTHHAPHLGVVQVDGGAARQRANVLARLAHNAWGQGGGEGGAGMAGLEGGVDEVRGEGRVSARQRHVGPGVKRVPTM